jgi:dihydroorotate dehydrogenase
MKLRGEEYGPICPGSGGLGFFGDPKRPEYWFHRWFKWFGLLWAGCTFVAKTMTLHKNVGNMPMKADGITPRDFKPDCIWMSHRHGIALNSVGLSNPGCRALLADGRWQARTEPFMLSFMPIGKDRAERFKETQEFVEILSAELPKFKAPVALQVNLSCPNTEHAAASLEEHLCLLDVLEKLGIPLVPKITVEYPVDIVYVVN